MPTTFSGDWPIGQTGNRWFANGIAPEQVLIITFSDGTQIAITNYDDKENTDAALSIPQDNVVNFSAFDMGAGGTFAVHVYDNGALGALVYAHTHPVSNSGAFRLVYNPATKGLTILYDAANQSTIDVNGDYLIPFNGTQLAAAPVCFLRGTLVFTDRGEVPVEELRAGDLVATRFGDLRRIRWIGTQSFDARFAGPATAPVRLAPGSLGEGRPHTALFVSPGHAILIAGGADGDVLVHAGALVNGTTITQPAPQGSIDYFHLDLAGHDCVLANGAWAETYFEDNNRDRFHNAATYRPGRGARAPRRQATCLPIVTAAHPALPAIRERLAPPGHVPHLLADGHPIPLAETAPGTWQATVPAGTTRLRLRSPAFRPPGEARTLGLMVHALSLDGAPLAPQGEGWHAPEQGWTWTDGNAALPPRAGTLVLRGWWPATETLRRRA